MDPQTVTPSTPPPPQDSSEMYEPSGFIEKLQNISGRQKLLILIVTTMIVAVLLAVVQTTLMSPQKDAITDVEPTQTQTQARIPSSDDDAVQVPPPAQITVAQVPTTALSVEPRSVTLSVGETSTLQVHLRQVPVTAVDIVLTYDPTLVEVLSLENGTIFERVIRQEIKDGRVTFSASINPENKDSLGTGPIFTLQVKGIAAGSSSFGFDDFETITALAGRNTLGDMTPADVVVQ